MSILKKVIAVFPMAALSLGMLLVAPSATAASMACMGINFGSAIPGERFTTPKRLAGQTRYGTAQKIVDEAFPQTSQYVVVASGEYFPDALASTGLAGALDAPLVLTNGNELSPETRTELQRLHPQTIVIVGGKYVVTDAVAAQIAQVTGLSPKRIAGENRYDTSYQVYVQGKALGARWYRNGVLVATGESFADALSASSYAYEMNVPIFLSNPQTGLSPDMVTVMKEDHIYATTIVGGSSVVPSDLIKAQTAAIPYSCSVIVAGANRYETSWQMASRSYYNAGTSVTFATGNSFPDALAGGVLAGVKKGPILLVENERSSTLKWLSEESRRGRVPDEVFILGGEKAISRSTANAIADAAAMTHS